MDIVVQYYQQVQYLYLVQSTTCSCGQPSTRQPLFSTHNYPVNWCVLCSVHVVVEFQFLSFQNIHHHKMFPIFWQPRPGPGPTRYSATRRDSQQPLLPVLRGFWYPGGQPVAPGGQHSGSADNNSHFLQALIHSRIDENNWNWLIISQQSYCLLSLVYCYMKGRNTNKTITTRLRLNKLFLFACHN